jgi:hypothetical protein
MKKILTMLFLCFIGYQTVFANEKNDFSRFNYIEISFKDNNNKIYLTNNDKRFSIIKFSNQNAVRITYNKIIIKKPVSIYLNNNYKILYSNDNTTFLNKDILFYHSKEYPNFVHNLVLFNDELWYGSYIDDKGNVKKQDNISY